MKVSFIFILLLAVSLSGCKTISNNFEFINPTFSPKEKIIRGVCYGHPSETEMYKYKWNGGFDPLI